MLPGFIEPHGHLFLAGVLTQPPVGLTAPWTAPTWTDVVAAFTAALRATDPKIGDGRRPCGGQLDGWSAGTPWSASGLAGMPVVGVVACAASSLVASLAIVIWWIWLVPS